MDLKKLRPTDNAASAIRAAIDAVKRERAAAEQRLADATAKRAVLLLSGSNGDIRGAEEAARDAELDLARLDVIGAPLAAQLSEAIARERDGALAERVRQAIDAIETYNDWLATQYEGHARGIAVGIELERAALRAREAFRDPMTKMVTAKLPPIANAFVGSTARSLTFLTRLPAAEPGPAIAWAS
jgi:hypothetical protein